jgi:hypothetical protein
VSKAIHANLYIWVIYYVFLRILGLDWNYQQAVTYVGSSYAALIPAIGLILLLLIEVSKPQKNFGKPYLLYYGTAVIASQIYYSRMLEFSILATTLLAWAFKRTFVSFITVIIVFFCAFTISGPIIEANYGHVSALKVNNPSVIDISKETASSANFIVNPRVSDSDRSQQIRCSTRLIFSNKNLSTKLFGYGQNNHKKALRACIEEKFGPVSEDKPIRPVGYAALVTDFGSIGLILVISLFLLVALGLRNQKSFLLYLVMLFQIAGWSLITNDLDHEFIYVVIFLNLLKYISQNLREQSKF